MSSVQPRDYDSLCYSIRNKSKTLHCSSEIWNSIHELFMKMECFIIICDILSLILMYFCDHSISTNCNNFPLSMYLIVYLMHCHKYSFCRILRIYKYFRISLVRTARKLYGISFILLLVFWSPFYFTEGFQCDFIIHNLLFIEIYETFLSLNSCSNMILKHSDELIAGMIGFIIEVYMLSRDKYIV